MGELLTLEEVGHLLKIKAETVRRLWIKQGKLTAVKVGRQWRVDADDLQKVLEAEALKQQEALERKRKPDAFLDLNTVIAPGGECTGPSQQDQLRRETQGRAFTPPDIPE